MNYSKRKKKRNNIRRHCGRTKLFRQSGVGFSSNSVHSVHRPSDRSPAAINGSARFATEVTKSRKDQFFYVDRPGSGSRESSYIHSLRSITAFSPTKNRNAKAPFAPTLTWHPSYPEISFVTRTHYMTVNVLTYKFSASIVD